MVNIEEIKNLRYIESERLYLRRLDRRDSEDMYEYAKLPEVTKYLLWSPHPSLNYTRDYINSVQRFYRNGEYFDYAVILQSERKMIGTCGFTKIDKNNNSAEAGYVINPAYHGKGYATEALLALMRFGINDMGINRIEARYMVGNDASRRVMERCGMKFEGIHRQQMLVKGIYVDIGVCALTHSDFVFRFGPDGSRYAVYSGSLFERLARPGR